MFNKSKKMMLVCLAAMATMTLGCSGSGGGSGGGGAQKPFGSDEQKAKALQVLGSSAKLVGLSNEATQSKQSSLNQINSILSLAQNESQIDGRTKPRDTRIADAIETGDCAVTVIGEDPRENKFSGQSAPGQKVDFKLTLSGSHCPVELTLEANGQASMQGNEANGNMNMDIGMRMELILRDESMARDYETRNLVVSAQIKMNVALSQGQPGQISLAVNGSMASTDLNSQKAEISLAVAANLQNLKTAPAGNLSIDVAIGMPEFRSTGQATIRLQGQQQAQGTYLIDGKAASEEEFAAWMKALEELGVGKGEKVNPIPTWN